MSCLLLLCFKIHEYWWIHILKFLTSFDFINILRAFLPTLYISVFQPFSSRGTSQNCLIIWRNLNNPYSTIYSIFREPRKKYAEPLGSAEPRLKNTAIHTQTVRGYILKLCTKSLPVKYCWHWYMADFLKLIFWLHLQYYLNRQDRLQRVLVRSNGQQTRPIIEQLWVWISSHPTK